MKTEYSEKLGLHIRPGTKDDWAAIDITKRMMDQMDVRAGDVCLDVGAHIGAFTLACLKKSAGRVVAVEPEPRNLELLKMNVDDGCVEFVRAAATDDPQLLKAGEASFYLNKQKHKGMHSLVKSRGRERTTVPVTSFRALLERVRPDRLKVDIEGGEYSLDWEDLPSSVLALHVEYHLTKKGFSDRARAVHDTIIAQGFEVLHEPNFEAMFGTHPVYRREG